MLDRLHIRNTFG